MPREAAAFGCALTLLGMTGCGGSDRDDHAVPRPPAAVVVSASIDDRSVQISPKRLGAGPITLVITNQSNAAQQVTLETQDTPGSGPGVKAVQTGPISPRETASVNAQVREGIYALHVGGDEVKAARLVVGRRRASSQNDLLQP